jgi:hypothetical protein
LRSSGKTAAQAAKAMNVSTRSVEYAAKVMRDGVPELQADVLSGAVAVSAAAEVATLPPDEQRAVLARGRRAVASAAREVREERKRPHDLDGHLRRLQEHARVIEEDVRTLRRVAEFDVWRAMHITGDTQAHDRIARLLDTAVRRVQRVLDALKGLRQVEAAVADAVVKVKRRASKEP